MQQQMRPIKLLAGEGITRHTDPFFGMMFAQYACPFRRNQHEKLGRRELMWRKGYHTVYSPH
ncbi:MAG: hypothetical protein JXA10_05635 [Anaerolineae bacterium]|nr:hypothetical protein [Anaerolineae bacterium]